MKQRHFFLRKKCDLQVQAGSEMQDQSNGVCGFDNNETSAFFDILHVFGLYFK